MKRSLSGKSCNIHKTEMGSVADEKPHEHPETVAVLAFALAESS
jgi:hypothetical protein